jgi:hypothetical protein
MRATIVPDAIIAPDAWPGPPLVGRQSLSALRKAASTRSSERSSSLLDTVYSSGGVFAKDGSTSQKSD